MSIWADWSSRGIWIAAELLSASLMVSCRGLIRNVQLARESLLLHFVAIGLAVVFDCRDSTNACSSRW